MDADSLKSDMSVVVRTFCFLLSLSLSRRSLGLYGRSEMSQLNETMSCGCEADAIRWSGANLVYPSVNALSGGRDFVPYMRKKKNERLKVEHFEIRRYIHTLLKVVCSLRS
jgi:hypothetical protein